MNISTAYTTKFKDVETDTFNTQTQLHYLNQQNFGQGRTLTPPIIIRQSWLRELRNSQSLNWYTRISWSSNSKTLIQQVEDGAHESAFLISSQVISCMDGLPRPGLSLCLPVNYHWLLVTFLLIVLMLLQCYSQLMDIKSSNLICESGFMETTLLMQ